MVELVDGIEDLAFFRQRLTRRVFQVEHRVGARAESHPLMFAGEKAVTPEPTVERLHVSKVATGYHHDKFRQVPVQCPETITQPRADTRTSGQAVASLHKGHRGVVVDRGRADGPDRADIIDDFTHVRQQLTHPRSTLTVLREIILGINHRVNLMFVGKPSEPSLLLHILEDVFAVELLQCRFVIEKI